MSVFERTAVRSVGPGRVDTEHGVVKADMIVRATEGFTPSLRGHARTVAPVYSLMVATE